jgi:hypothetical protein
MVWGGEVELRLQLSCIIMSQCKFYKSVALAATKAVVVVNCLT